MGSAPAVKSVVILRMEPVKSAAIIVISVKTVGVVLGVETVLSTKGAGVGALCLSRGRGVMR